MSNQPNYTIDSQSCFFIGRSGLFKLRCPFLVQCIHPVAEFLPGDSLYVEAIKTNSKNQLVFVIEQKPYLYSAFVYL